MSAPSTAQPVSFVLPCLDDRDLLEKHLPPLQRELAGRGIEGDEILVVDDTGRAALESWLAEHFPAVRVQSREANGGFAKALLSGVEAAANELVFCMNPDVLVHPGFLEPLIACLDDPQVHSAVPRVLLNGADDSIESLTEIDVFRGLGSVRQRGLEGEAQRFTDGVTPVAYAVGGTCMLRRSEFVGQNGFDPLYEPFYWEDVDLGWDAWRNGKSVVYEPASIVEHHHRGTIGKRVPKDIVRAMIEKNRLLFQWKFLDTQEALERHIAALYRYAVDSWLREDRDELVWLCLALDQVDEVLKVRAELPPAQRNFEEIRRASQPR